MNSVRINFMSYIVDLHTHSRFSRACSNKLTIPNLVEWAKYKGIDVLGTGDFLHPMWFAELKKDLKEDGSGFLQHNSSNIKFALSVEVASIYTHHGKGRRVHNIVLMPTFFSAQKLQKKLTELGANLTADGRPIVGISSKNLLEICLEIDEKALFIPAHAWTPWFGVFGSQSGYDSLEECFEDLTKYVYAIETGLSSDPAMNWRVKELDNKSILSFSDAHSLPNLGREMTVIGGDLKDGYKGLWEAITYPSVILGSEERATQESKKQDSGQATFPLAGTRMTENKKIIETIEFYPEEGKYHYTGHRNCGIIYTPEDSKKRGTVCPVCGRGLTVGVMERVEQLATRSNAQLAIKNAEGKITSNEFSEKSSYRMLVPLQQVIAESFGFSTSSKKVQEKYLQIVKGLGSEVSILTKVSIEDIARFAGEKIAEGVQKVRTGDLDIDPGYDGVYGVVRIWGDEKSQTKNQMELFS